MPIHTASDSEWTTWTWREPAPLFTLVKLLGFFALLTPFGLGVLALGSATFEVRCQRDVVMACTLTEHYLFGLAPLTRSLPNVQEVSLVDVGDEGATVMQLSGPTGAIRSSGFSSSLDRSKQRALVKAVAARLGGPFFIERQSMVAWPFLLFGSVGTLLWALLVWALVTTPFALVWPTRLRCDRERRLLRIRKVRAWPFEKEVASRAVREVALTRNPGGPFGAFVATPRPEVPAPSLHVVLALADGTAMRLVNGDQTADAEVRAFAQQLAHALGCPCHDSDEWRPTSG